MSEYTDEQICQALLIGKCVEQARKAADAIEHEVWCARQMGMSWVKVGMALGTSGQAAWERYGLTYEQKLQRSVQNTGAVKNVQLEGLDLPPEPLPHKRQRKHRNKRGQADK